MNTIEKLGDEETFRQIVERSITSFIDDELTTIVGASFYGCKELQEVSLPLITKLPYWVFQECSKLTTFDASSITEIENSAFLGCSSLSSLIVGTDLDDETAICTLASAAAIPSSIGAIYVPYNLVNKYKTATNWSSFASKIQAYETLVSCQSLMITAEDVPGYKTSTVVHYEAICTYSIEGIMQTGTKVFKGDTVSNTFGTNPSGESSRQVEVSYTLLGKTATTTITQGKYLGNPVGGKIFYIDDTADGTYEFYDVEEHLMPDVSVGSTPSYCKVLIAGSKDKYYVYHDEIYTPLQWSNQGTTTGASGTAIGTGKSNTATLLATNAVSSTTTIWYKLQQIRNASTGECNDWFIPSKDEVEALRLAIGCTTSTSGAVVVDAGAVTGGNIAGTADGKTHYQSSGGTYYCYPSNTKFLNDNILSSSETDYFGAWTWRCFTQCWDDYNKINYNSSVFFVRSF